MLGNATVTSTASSRVGLYPCTRAKRGLDELCEVEKAPFRGITHKGVITRSALLDDAGRQILPP